MADEGNGGQASADQQAQPSLNIVAQYVKDLSFENPGAPKSLQQRAASPNINISVGVQANALTSEEVEVELKIESRAVDGEKILFIIELVYAGIFRMKNRRQGKPPGADADRVPAPAFPVRPADRGGGESEWWLPAAVDRSDRLRRPLPQSKRSQGRRAAGTGRRWRQLNRSGLDRIPGLRGQVPERGRRPWPDMADHFGRRDCPQTSRCGVVHATRQTEQETGREQVARPGQIGDRWDLRGRNPGVPRRRQ